MRKAARSIWAAAAPLPFPATEEESRAKFRLRNLMRECVELQKETVAKKRRLQMGKQRLLTLNAEVSFLRRRYKYLTKNSSTGLFRVKDLPRKNLTRIEHKARKRHAGINTQFTSRQDVPYGRQIDREPPVPSALAVIDLNKTLLAEGEGETHVALYPLPSQNSSKNNLSDEGTPGNRSKSLHSLDVGTSTNGIGRKKMSHVAVRIC